MATTISPVVHFAAKATPFQRELTRRVEAYFAHRSKHGGLTYFAKAAFWLVAVGVFWALVVFAQLPWWVFVVLCVLRGFCVAQIGFNVGHDAIHQAASRSRLVNALLARSYELMGASSRTWAWAHNVVHHTYTNVPGVDHDLEPGFFLHFHPQHARRGTLLRFQHLYAWVLYGFTALVWVFKKDFAQLRARGSATTLADVLDVTAGKVFHVAVWLVLPLLLASHGWWYVLVGYLLSSLMTGLTAAVVFQLAHVVEGPSFPVASEGLLSGDFHSHQLRTTSNFAPAHPLASFFTGGLNHQVEHHLFPRVCHTHYPALSGIVKACAREFGVPYHEHRSFFAALASHARVLRALGRPVPASS